MHDSIENAENKHRLCVIVPAYNEDRSIGAVVGKIRASAPKATIVVVDDGSLDNTSKNAKKAGAFTITLPVNLGIGGAVQTGYRYAFENSFEIAVQIDGDGQHDPAELPNLLEPLINGSADMVIGSRWLGKGHYKAPKDRRLGMRILSKLVSWKTSNQFTDTTSGFRAVNVLGISLFAESYPRDFPEVETIILATNSGLRIQEVPFVMNKREFGVSSIGGLKSIYYMTLATALILLGTLDRKKK